MWDAQGLELHHYDVPTLATPSSKEWVLSLTHVWVTLPHMNLNFFPVVCDAQVTKVKTVEGEFQRHVGVEISALIANCQLPMAMNAALQLFSHMCLVA